MCRSLARATPTLYSSTNGETNWTATHWRNLEMARRDFAELRQEVIDSIEIMQVGIEAELEAGGAPWTPGRRIPPG